jgi:hypothetical protein
LKGRISLSDTLSLKDAAPVIEEILLSGGKVKILASGRSMEPVICDGQDTVVLKKAEGKLQTDDIVLFKRDSGNLVLHRIIAFDGNQITLRGDSQWTTETVDSSRVMGVLDSIERNGQLIKADSEYFEKYKKILPFLRWKNRLTNSIKIRLGAKNK